MPDKPSGPDWPGPRCLEPGEDPDAIPVRVLGGEIIGYWVETATGWEFRKTEPPARLVRSEDSPACTPRLAEEE